MKSSAFCTRDTAGCVAAGTLVRTPRGLVPIERLGLGDSVITQLGRERRAATIVRTQRALSTDLVRVHFSDRSSVDTTPWHRFIDPSGSLWPAEHVGRGMIVRAYTGGVVRVAHVEPIARGLTYDVFDLVLDAAGSYFANGQLVEAGALITAARAVA